MKKKIAAFFMAASVASCMSGCSTASTVNHNLSKDANEFNVYRRITIINFSSEHRPSFTWHLAIIVPTNWW